MWKNDEKQERIANRYKYYGESLKAVKENQKSRLRDLQKKAKDRPQSLIVCFTPQIVGAYLKLMWNIAQLLGADRDRLVEQIRDMFVFEVEFAKVCN